MWKMLIMKCSGAWVSAKVGLEVYARTRHVCKAVPEIVPVSARTGGKKQ